MSLANPLILLADDDPNDVELTIRALRASNIAADVDVVSDGQELLDYLRCEGDYGGRDRRQPNLILLDIKMPRMDGLETLAEIKNDPALRTIPVVMLTSSREPTDLTTSYASGTNAYVVKPNGYTRYVDAVMRIGAFWAKLNVLPPPAG